MQTPPPHAWCRRHAEFPFSRGAQAACLHKPAASRRSQLSLIALVTAGETRVRRYGSFYSFALASDVIIQSVSTLAEIEAAADSLPLDQKKKLLEFLAARVNGGQPKRQRTDLRKFAGAVRLSEDPLAWQQRVRGEWE